MLTTLTCALAFSLGAPAIKEPPKKDSPSLIGEWRACEDINEQGVISPRRPGDLVLRFGEKGKLHATKKMEDSFHHYTIDTTRSPWQIDLIQTTEDKAVTIQAIFKFEDDALHICIAKPGMVRPTEFTTSVIKFERVGKK